MRRRRFLGHDVEHDDTAHHERITDHRTMASPWHSFRAHDRYIAAVASLDQQVDRVGELLCLHVVRVPLERCGRTPFGEPLAIRESMRVNTAGSVLIWSSIRQR